MIQIYKIFHGMDKMEMESNFRFNKVRREVTVLNIIEKFLDIHVGQILSLIDHLVCRIPCQIN